MALTKSDRLPFAVHLTKERLRPRSGGVSGLRSCNREALLRLLLPFCYGFVTALTSISIRFYRDVTGVTGQRGGSLYTPLLPFPFPHFANRRASHVKSEEVQSNPSVIQLCLPLNHL